METTIETSLTDDTAAAVHPAMTTNTILATNENMSLPIPPPPPPSSIEISPLSHSKMSPTEKKKRFASSGSPSGVSRTATPKSGLTSNRKEAEPVGLTLNILTSPNKSTTPASSPNKTSKLGNLPIPVDSPNPNMPVETDLEIEDGTPAAEALRANADVKVTKVGKVARFLHVQAVRKTTKKFIHVGSGVKRGKPPRVPDSASEDFDQFVREDGQLDILLESDEDDEEYEEIQSVEGEEDVLFQSAHSHQSDGDGEYKHILMRRSSDSSDPDVPVKVAMFDERKLTLLDTKGKRREVRLDRKMKRKMKKLGKKKARNYVKGKVIDGEHELYTLSIAMMLGLRYSIFLTNNQLAEDRKNARMWLDSDEFMKVEKYIFRPDGRKGTPPHQLSHTFKFKDYSPLPFAFIRRMFGINEYEFHHSVCGNANFIEFISNAKSGQFFFYSSDGKYMIKTMTNAESKFLRRSKYTRDVDVYTFVFCNHPISFPTTFTPFSSATLFPTLLPEPKHNSYKVPRNVSRETLPS